MTERIDKSPYFEVLEKGNTRLKGVEAKVVPTGRELPDELRGSLDERWDNYPGKKWPNDEKPSRFRYEGSRMVGNVLVIRSSPTVSFKDFATWSHELTEKHGFDAAPRSLFVSTIIVTPTEVMLTRRSSKNEYKLGGLSGVGGAITIENDSSPDGSPDFLGALRREVEEESGLRPNEITPVLNAIMHDPISGAVTLSYISTTELSPSRINRRKHDDENTLEFVDLKPKAIQNLILTRTNTFTTETLALLIALGEEKFGKAWAEETNAIFRLRGIAYAEAIKRGPEVVQKLESKDILKDSIYYYPLLECANKAFDAITDLKSAREVVAKKEGVENFVTRADLASQAAIEEVVRKRLPNASFLSEESTDKVDPKKPGIVIIVDPLDGTTNFKEGNKKGSAICIGVVANGVEVACIVKDINTGDIYFAEKGKGAYRNGIRLRVGTKADLSKATVTCDKHADPAIYQRIKELHQKIRPKQEMLRYGSAVLGMCKVATSETDIYFHLGLYPWDNMAMLMVTEAGGVITSPDGRNIDFTSMEAVMGNKNLVTQFVERSTVSS